MNRHRFLVGLLVALFAWSFRAPSASPTDDFTWFDNYAAALREAKRTGKPIFLEFRCEP